MWLLILKEPEMRTFDFLLNPAVKDFTLSCSNTISFIDSEEGRRIHLWNIIIWSEDHFYIFEQFLVNSGGIAVGKKH